MMDYLITRLRWTLDDSVPKWVEYAMRDAADEIERQRFILKTYIDHVSNMEGTDYLHHRKPLLDAGLTNSEIDYLKRL